MKNTMRWTKHLDGVFGARATVVSTTTDGRSRTVAVDLRIDARGDTVRVDRHGAFGWEAIDGGVDGLPSVKDAKAYATRWVRAANEQRTVTPNMTPHKWLCATL